MTLPCGCCEGIHRMTPVTIANPPNLSQLSYRVGTYASFFDTMLARLSDYQLLLSDYERLVRDPPGVAAPLVLQPLAGLTTRSLDDPSIALLDAWAIVADVLTFYQERIANEGYLPTATERRSIMELAALAGYTLRPAVAASSYLAFTLQDGFAGEVPGGTRAQTLPGPGEKPQPFETSATLSARAEWNALRPRQTRPQDIKSDTVTSIYLKGTATGLKANDPLLLVFEHEGKQLFRRVKTVSADPVNQWTLIELRDPQEAAVAAAVQAARRMLRHHLAPANVPSPGSELAREVTAILEDTYDRLSAVMSSSRLAGLLRRTIARLRRRHQLAKERRFARLEEWIGGVLRGLEEILASVPPPLAAAPPQARVVKPDFPPELASFYRLLGPLAKAPSVSPVSPSALAPTIRQVFSPGSDLQVEILAALRPGAVSPYRAWANAQVTPPSPVTVYALRLTAQLFGHAAPKHYLARDDRYVEWPIIEANKPPHEQEDVLFLDGNHPAVLADDWIVISMQATPLQTDDGDLITRVRNAQADLSRADYGISGTVTRVEIKSGKWIHLDTEASEDEAGEDESTESTDEPGELDEQEDFEAIRKTVVYTQPEKLELAEGPVQEGVGHGTTGDGTMIELGSLYEGLVPGRLLIVAGDRTDVPNTTVPGAELVMLDQVVQSFNKDLPGDRVVSTLHLANSLSFSYKRETAVAYGNVVAATLGESHREILGSGDGSKASQAFTVRHPYLTYVAANNAKGVASTLNVLVDGLPWTEVDGLAGAGPKDHVYTTRTANDGKTTIIFGDGQRGARLPSGSENVLAIYRTGPGTAASAAAGQISLLATKPLGVKAVVNPMEAAAGADPEGIASGRRNASLGVAPLDRLVSVGDYEQFALGFGGVGKASAIELWDGRHEIVHVTVAGMDSGPLAATSQLLQSLLTALSLSGDRSQRVEVAPRAFLFLVLAANISITSGSSWDDVSAAIRQRLIDRFGFDARSFGQDVVPSEVISVIQGVDGVASVELTFLDAVPESATPADLAAVAMAGVRRRIRARLAHRSPRGDRIIPARLIILKPDLAGTLLLTQVTL